MRICKVWDADYPWDVRVEKVARSLTAAGHSVHLVARNKLQRPAIEVLPEATVHRFTRWPLGIRFDNASTFPAFVNPRWAAAIYRTARDNNSELILVRDLPLAPTAIAVARLLGLPVVLDMAENYPAMTKSLYDNGVNKPWDIVVRNPNFVSAIERWVLRHIDHVIVVVEESRDRIVQLGYPRNRISIVGNTPPIGRLDAFARRQHVQGRVEMNYLGLVEAPRGLETVINAIRRCVDLKIDIHLSVIGDGRERPRFESQANNLGLLNSMVSFRGNLPYPQALNQVAQSDIGIVPHQASESWNTTIPNKLFDYMSLGLAIITSDAKPAARIVRETQTGLVYRHNDVGALVDAISALSDAAVRSEYGNNGRNAVRSGYNWEVSAVELEQALHKAMSDQVSKPQ